MRTTKWQTATRALLGITVVGMLIIPAAAATRTVTNRVGSDKTASSTETRAIVHVAQQQADLLTEALAGWRNSQIAEARLGAPPETMIDNEELKELPGAVWVFFKVRATDRFDYKRGKWQGLVTAGLLRDESRARGLAPVYGYSFRVVWPGGAEEFDGDFTMSPSLQRPRPVRKPLPSELRNLVRPLAAAVKSSLVGVEVSLPLGRVAPEIHVSTGEPNLFMTKRSQNVWQIVGLLNGKDKGERKDPLVEGAYLEVRDLVGRLVTVSAYSVRTGHGTGASNPEFAAGPDSVGGAMVNR